jgi:acetoin utilization deacetylase AcuC-like enzyme
MTINIFYNSKNDLRLLDFGIEIPVAGDRALKVFDSLKEKNPDLKTFDKHVPPFTREDLMRVHNADYVSRLYDSEETLLNELMTCFELINKDGSYNRYNPTIATKKLSDAFEIILNRVTMTYVSSKSALVTGFSYHLGGGSHHAMSFGGRGFGLLNDIVITLRKLQAEGLIKTAWVVDVDAHKGDGTSELTQKDETITTLSIHMRDGWPLDQGNPETDPWFIPSNIEIGIGAEENRSYLLKLKAGLVELESKFAKPDLVLVVNGADPYEHDGLPSSGLLKLTKEEMLERDMMIYNFFSERKIPQSYVMSGGYGDRSWEIYFQFLNKLCKNYDHV